jgi:hypothetical protein
MTDMGSHARAPIGTAYFPEADVRPSVNGQQPAALAPGKLRGLPRRRRPAMLALAVAMAGAGVLVSATLYRQASHSEPVVVVTASIPPGAVITAADLTTADVRVPAGIHVIPGAQLAQVSGAIAAVSLRPGTLLAPADLTTSLPPGPGQDLVAIAVKPEALPASGLVAGNRVLIVATPGDQGQAGTSSLPASLPAPVAGVVEAVSTAVDQQGFDVVDVLVAKSVAVAVAAQASTGQVALVITSRGG